MENGVENRIELGRRGEEAAGRYLVEEGFRIVDCGFRFGRGEIDIIAFDGPTLVFIEVKTRTDADHGFPEEAVTAGKRRQIRRIALGFLTEHGEYIDIPCRFDVIAVEWENSQFVIRHLRDAF